MNRGSRLKIYTAFTVVILSTLSLAQTKSAFDGKNGNDSASVTPKKLSVNHSVTFGMTTTSFSKSDLKSQGLYSTMLTYKLSPPITLKLDFGLPIYSTFNDKANPTPSNFQSLDYFKNMPVAASILWKPSDNMLMNISIVKGSSDYYYQPQFFENTFNRGFKEPLYNDFRRTPLVKH